MANFNPGWRFHKGDVEGAEKVDFDDSNWEAASLPHGLNAPECCLKNREGNLRPHLRKKTVRYVEVLSAEQPAAGE